MSNKKRLPGRPAKCPPRLGRQQIFDGLLNRFDQDAS